MLAVKRIRLVGDHRDQVLHRILRRAGTTEISRLPTSELRARAEHILTNLPAWIASRNEAIEQEFHEFGGRVFTEGLPLDGVVRAFQLIRDDILAYVSDQAVPLNAVDQYGEEEFAIQMMRLFDAVIVGVVHGHQRALKEQLKAAA